MRDDHRNGFVRDGGGNGLDGFAGSRGIGFQKGATVIPEPSRIGGDFFGNQGPQAGFVLQEQGDGIGGFPLIGQFLLQFDTSQPRQLP